MIDIAILNTIQKVMNSILTPFTFKLADSVENIRVNVNNLCPPSSWLGCSLFVVRMYIFIENMYFFVIRMKFEVRTIESLVRQVHLIYEKGYPEYDKYILTMKKYILSTRKALPY